ncbi:hypothetical protein HPK19_04585 [Arthrobacter citreus]|nr:hypothetical protein HPK19_04585 [Arthrobacter citreus]
MKFNKTFTVIFVLLLALLSACSGGEKTATKEPKYKEIPQSAIQSTIDDMKTREHIKDATFEVNGDKIEMKLVVDDASFLDKNTARDYADSYLRTISIYVEDSNPTKDSYGKVYDGYYVHIVVEDTQGMEAIEGDILPGYPGVTWQ